MKLIIYYLNAGAFALMVLVNYLANSLPLNNLDTAEISDMFPVLFTPAGYVFSIWILIYLLLAGFVIYQLAYRPYHQSLVPSVGSLFIISCLLNTAWIFSWHYLQISLSLVIMIALLINLIIIYTRVNQTKRIFAPHEKWLVKLPFSIYLGWICVATIANFNVLLYNFNLYTPGISAGIVTIIMIIIAALIALYVFITRNDIALVLVFAWAFVGIGVRHGLEVFTVTTVSWLAAALIIFLILWVNRRKFQEILP